MTKPSRSLRYLPLRTTAVLFPGAAQHVAHKGVYARLRGLCGVVRCRPGIVPGSESGLSGFGEDMMWNDPGLYVGVVFARRQRRRDLVVPEGLDDRADLEARRRLRGPEHER